MAPLCTVYGLYSTEDTVVRYIGQTTQKPQSRLRQHFAEATRPPGRSRCHRWIRKVLRSGHTLGFVILEENCLWNEAEKRWIAHFRAKHPEIMTNLSDGGCGYNGKRSEETRKRMRWPRSKKEIARLRKLISSPDVRRKALIALAKRNPGNTYGRGEKNAGSVLTEKRVMQIRKLLEQEVSLSKIAKSYGMSKAAISKIRSGRTWKHLGGLQLPTRR